MRLYVRQKLKIDKKKIANETPKILGIYNVNKDMVY